MAQTLPEFTWRPDLGAQSTNTPLVQKVSFGDGYEQRVGESLNRVRHDWDLTFTRDIEEILAIRDFLEARAGLEAFSWTTTIGETKAFVCREWQGPSQQYRGVYVITAKFEEVFEA